MGIVCTDALHYDREVFLLIRHLNFKTKSIECKTFGAYLVTITNTHEWNLAMPHIQCPWSTMVLCQHLCATFPVHPQLCVVFLVHSHLYVMFFSHPQLCVVFLFFQFVHHFSLSVSLFTSAICCVSFCLMSGHTPPAMHAPLATSVVFFRWKFCERTSSGIRNKST